MQILNSILLVLSSLATLIFSVYYLIRKISMEGILLTCGSFIGLLSTIASFYLTPYLLRNEGITSSTTRYLALSGIITSISYISFTVGFVILILKHLESQKEQTNA